MGEWILNLNELQYEPGLDTLFKMKPLNTAVMKNISSSWFLFLWIHKKSKGIGAGKAVILNGLMHQQDKSRSMPKRTQ